MRTLTLFLLSSLLSCAVWCANRTDAALTLLEPTGARTAALGEAATALPNDITGLVYNPANIQTLSSGQVSILFQRGLSEDRYGHLAIGKPGTESGLGWGLSVGYYDSGAIQVFDGSSQRSVTGQKDLLAGFSLAQTFGKLRAGLTAKHFSTEIGETSSANTMLADVGASMPVGSRLNLGAAVQNMGGKLEYSGLNEELPRQARLGLSWNIAPFSAASIILIDGVYRMEQQEWDPALGLETKVGPLALRAGYRSGRDLEEFTVGTGFFWNSTSLDYAFGFVEELNSTHRVSLTNRFGSMPASTPIVKKKPQPEAPLATFAPPTLRPVYEIKRAEGENPPARVYFVREGDTLKTIAKMVYGREEMWEEIYRANQHLLADPDNFRAGQKIILPAGATQ